MMNGIIPRSKAKGTDICGVYNYTYIIRSDLGCFMETYDLNKGSTMTIYSLHPSCKDGEHYAADGHGYFYIIKGSSYRTVSSLETDNGAVVQSLHPKFQGGDHYLYSYGYFYIIFQEKGIYRKTGNLNYDSGAVDNDLPPNCGNGLYYWGNPFHFSFLKPTSDWGVEFHSGAKFCEEPCFDVYSVHPDVVNFLPGGLSVTKGPSFGMWEKIKTITNDSNTPVNWQRKINKKVGYNKEKMTEITHNWKISMSVSAETGGLGKLIAKAQFSFSAEYGGSHVNTEKESWSELTEVEETLSFKLEPNESVYLWQYKLGLGKEPVLFCHDLKADNDPNPPTEVPLPPAQS